jgi:sulfatase modifying factor 1
VSDCIYGCSDDHPVQSVTWLEAVEWANELSLREGLTPAYVLDDGGATPVWTANGWRLPTEAEWEIAARAGGTVPWSGSGSWEDVAWCGGPADPPYEARPVGTKEPNAWGFHDMSGNVAEWVWDRYGDYPSAGTAVDPTGPSSGSMRVHRGGMFAASSPTECRVARRYAAFESTDNWNRGFRIARFLD